MLPRDPDEGSHYFNLQDTIHLESHCNILEDLVFLGNSNSYSQSDCFYWGIFCLIRLPAACMPTFYVCKFQIQCLCRIGGGQVDGNSFNFYFMALQVK